MEDEKKNKPDVLESEKDLIDEDYTADIDLSAYFLEEAKKKAAQEAKEAEEKKKQEEEKKQQEEKQKREEERKKEEEARQKIQAASSSFEAADAAFEKARQGRENLAAGSGRMKKLELSENFADEIKDLSIEVPERAKEEEKAPEPPAPVQEEQPPVETAEDEARAARKAQRRRWSRLYVAVCAAIVLAVTVIGIVMQRPDHSDTEKRDLAAFPTVTLAGLMDGSWFSDLVTWYADTFPVREQLISLEAKAESLYGVGERIVVTSSATADEVPDAEDVEVAPTLEIPASSTTEESTEAVTEAATEAATTEETTEATTEAAAAKTTEETTEEAATEESTAEDGAITAEPEAVGTIYIADGTGFSVYYFNKEAVDTYASMVNTVAAYLPDCSVYAMPTPNSFGIMLSEDTQRELSQPEQGVFTYMFAKFSDDVKKVNVYQNLLDHNSEYIYFRTDHHWTALGAYYAYEVFCEVKGIEPTPIEDYETQVSEGFLGSYYAYSNHSPELAANPDTITAYIPIATNTMKMTQMDGTVVDYPIIQEGDTYSVFIGGDEPMEVIDNPDLNDGSAVLLVKDSYGDAFAPFLVDSYDKVYIADFRYCEQNLASFIEENNIQDVILENNVEFLTTENAQLVLADFGFSQ